MKNTYFITVRETLERCITVDAETEEEALRKVKDDYINEDIVLDSDDYVDTEFIIHS